MNNDCIFCKIANKKIESKLLYENELTAAFFDIAPRAPTHILVIPKKHIENLSEINPDLSSAIFSAINSITKQLESFRIVMNYGADSGQMVPHLHFHILSGRKFSWPPG